MGHAALKGHAEIRATPRQRRLTVQRCSASSKRPIEAPSKIKSTSGRGAPAAAPSSTALAAGQKAGLVSLRPAARSATRLYAPAKSITRPSQPSAAAARAGAAASRSSPSRWMDEQTCVAQDGGGSRSEWLVRLVRDGGRSCSHATSTRTL